jgi:hypothetical protein
MFNKQTHLTKIAASLFTLTCLAVTSAQATEVLKPLPINTAEITKAAQLNIAQSISAFSLKTNAVKADFNTLFNTTAKKAKPVNTTAIKSELIAE